MNFLRNFLSQPKSWLNPCLQKEREERKAELTPIHKRIIDQIAQYVMKCDPQVVEDFILDTPKQIELISDFAKKGTVFMTSLMVKSCFWRNFQEYS